MQLFLKKYGQFIFLFFFILYGFLVAYNLYFGDTIVNYGFSYAITRGEIPYVDYNLIIPLFSPFLYSIFLFVCKSFLFYYIVQSIFVVLFFVVVSKLLILSSAVGSGSGYTGSSTRFHVWIISASVSVQLDS